MERQFALYARQEVTPKPVLLVVQCAIVDHIVLCSLQRLFHVQPERFPLYLVRLPARPVLLAYTTKTLDRQTVMVLAPQVINLCTQQPVRYQKTS